MRLILATLLALAAFPANALAAPEVVTGPATTAGQTTATLTGTVDPDGDPATYRFQYGTTDEYGLVTPERSLPAGDEPVPVQDALTGLSPATTYHYRLVSGEAQGEDRTFTTAAAAPQPGLPGVSRRGSTGRTATSVTLKARIDPNRAATTYLVEWGFTDALGSVTPEQKLPAGDEPVAVQFPLAGLPAHTRIFWRVVATNAAGVRRSTIRSLTTRRAPTGVTAIASTDLARWGQTVTVSGHVDGAGVSGMSVALEQATFPFLSPFAAVATARVDSSGNFVFRPRQALIATRWRVVTRTSPAFTSAEAPTAVRPRLATRIPRRTRRSVRLKAAVNPGLPGATARLQRRAAGRWVTAKRKLVRTVDELRSTATFSVKRSTRARRFRIKVTPADDAYLPVKGGAVRVSRR